MSWKSVEMQVALPRTQDASKIQEQFQQRGQQVQDTLAKSQLDTDELKRKQVNDYQQRDNVNNKEKNENMESLSQKADKQTEQDSGFKHPYLGNEVDING